jgi:type II secretory pathway pseudopilin PulG
MQRKDFGFTTLELFATMTIFALVLFLAAQQVSELLNSYNRRNAEMVLLEDMRLAQATTVKEGCHGILQIASDGKSYTFGCDYVPCSEEYPPLIEKQFFTRRLPRQTRVESDEIVMFNSRGQCIDDSESLATRTITLRSGVGSEYQTFNTGTVRSTGFFSYGG